MTKRQLPSPDILRQLLDYDPGTGTLRWKYRPLEFCASTAEWKRWNKQFAGRAAFVTVTGPGYHRGTVRGVCIFAHRVVWALVYGEWPDGEIDHIDGDRSNNRIANLRAVRSADNNRNRSIPNTNSSGAMGIRRTRANRWRASIVIDGKSIHLGIYNEFRDAQIAREAAQKALGFAPGHGRKSRAMQSQENE